MGKFDTKIVEQKGISIASKDAESSITRPCGYTFLLRNFIN